MAAPGFAGQVNVDKQTIGGQDRVFVDVPHISIGDGAARVKSVKWVNNTKDLAVLWFPNGDLIFDGTTSVPRVSSFLDPIKIPAEGLTLQVKSVPKFGHYHYHVYCEAVKDCAEGKSEPRVSVP